MKNTLWVILLVTTSAISIGISYGMTYNENVIINSTYSLGIGGSPNFNNLLTVTGNAPPPNGGEIDALAFNPTFTQSATYASLYTTYPVVNSGSNTITNLYGMWIRSGALTSGTVTNHYGIYVENPSFGTNQYGIYVAGGSPALDIANGDVWISSGKLGIGGSPNSNNLLTVTGNAPPPNGGEIDALAFNPTFTQSATYASLYTTYPVVNSGSNTITNLYGMWIRSGALTSGTVTNHYGIYVENPSFGTNQYGIYVAGGNNYLGGNLGIGTSSPQAPLDVSGNIRTTGNLTTAAAKEFTITAPVGIPICIGTGC